jgi:hypothetical protein
MTRRHCFAACIFALCAPLLSAEPTVTKTTWREIDAYKLTDGRAEAIVVPKLGGRIVAFGLVGGTNFIWSGEPGAEKREPPLMWGGDKTYIGPDSLWPLTRGKGWPPPAPDSAAHTAEILPGGRLRIVSTPWEDYGGARITRECGFDAAGEFVTTHTIEKIPGSQKIGAVWDIAQTIPSDGVFVPLNPKSAYKENYFWFGFSKPTARTGVHPLSPSLLKLKPATGEMFKLGADIKTPALATVKDGIAFITRADPQEGQYPDGAPDAGLSVEVYHHDLPGPGEYVELELLSPVRRLDQGATLTTRWSLREWPANPPHGEAMAAEKLLAP